MTLDARQRSSLFEKFVPLLGEDDANAMMSNFPDSEAHELVTKEFLRAELADVRGEISVLRFEIAERFQKQTTWMVATMVAMTGIFSAIVSLG